MAEDMLVRGTEEDGGVEDGGVEEEGGVVGVGALGWEVG